MAAIEAAGVRLIIGPESVGELIQAWDRLAATEKSVLEDTFAGESTAGVRIITPEHGRMVENFVRTSPTYRRLLRLIRTLEHEERVDLLVLGWLGRDERMTRRRLLDHAIRMVDQLSVHYIAYLGAHWRAGQARVAGQEPT